VLGGGLGGAAPRRLGLHRTTLRKKLDQRGLGGRDYSSSKFD
jgi:DNA-binding NtrC family response regulator